MREKETDLAREARTVSGWRASRQGFKSCLGPDCHCEPFAPNTGGVAVLKQTKGICKQERAASHTWKKMESFILSPPTTKY